MFVKYRTKVVGGQVSIMVVRHVVCCTLCVINVTAKGFAVIDFACYQVDGSLPTVTSSATMHIIFMVLLSRSTTALRC